MDNRKKICLLSHFLNVRLHYSNLEYCPIPACDGGPLSQGDCDGAFDGSAFGAVRNFAQAEPVLEQAAWEPWKGSAPTSRGGGSHGHGRSASRFQESLSAVAEVSRI